ncbi:MAG: hypothetical protein HUK16_04045 [Bacteroidales bacterium]|nr:hypothetical protein [Bacteroidales bacterium]
MRKIGWIIAVFILALQGCKMPYSEDKGVVVAECCGKYLYETDLMGVVPPGLEILDSLARVNAFVDTWIRRELLLFQSESNLTKEELDFSKEIQDYRNSMVIYAYESKLLDQKLDTIVSEAEIEAYYEANKANFQLHQAMVKVAYVIVKNDSKQLKNFERTMRSSDTLDLPSLDMMAAYFAVSSYLDVDTWIRLDDLLKVVPIEIYNTESFFKKNRFVSFEKDDLCYMVRFEHYLLEEEISPLEMEMENIKSVILMKRRKNLIDELNAELYDRAQKEHLFEVYTGASATAVE